MNSPDGVALRGTATSGGFGLYSNGKAHVQGNITISGSATATAYYQSSDRNLKDDIRPITDPFALLDAIEGKHFIWKDSRQGSYSVIAQDVSGVMPEAVSKNADGYMTVEYGQLIAPLIEAVKILKAENDYMREEIRALTEGSR